MSDVIRLPRLISSALALILSLGVACGDDGISGSSGSASASEATGDSASTTAAADTSGSASATETGSASGSASDSASGTGSADGCTSQRYWTQGDLESPLMHPGGACLDCHNKQVGEDIVGRLAIAGTVYPTLHEPDDCDGVTGADGPVTVEITTADDVVLTLAVNAAGNFFYDLEESPAITFPIKAKVKRGGEEMVMAAAQMSGDCNSCHTEAGTNNAPGRILAP